MKPDDQCRMLTGKGKRCPYRGINDGFCARHRKLLDVKRKAIDKLVSAGEVAAAITALIKLVEIIAHVYPQIVLTMREILQSMMFSIYEYEYEGKRDNHRALLIESLQLVSKNSDKLSSVDFGKLTNSTFDAILYRPPPPSPLF
jgi:hypothetical protein